MKKVMLKEPIHFAIRFLQNPRSVGAFLPSGRALGRKMADAVDWQQTRTVLEIGPGSGALTAEFLPRVQQDCRFMAVEISHDFASFLQSRFSGLEVVRDTVENLPRILRQRGIHQVDAIISGLPWANFMREEQDRCMKAIKSGLAPAGVFVTYSYLQSLTLPRGRRLLRRLKDNFTYVRRSKPVWSNVPPAVYFTCRL